MKAIIYTILSLLITSESVLGQNVCDLNLTAANGSTNGQVERNTVLLSVHEHISWTYEATTDITLQIHDVKYINKAGQSGISLYSDDSIIGYYTTTTSDSNKLMSSGIIGLLD